MQASSTALTATGGSNTTLTADQASTFLHTLQQRKQLRPVCMTMAVIAQGGDLVVDEEQADLLPVLQVRTLTPPSTQKNMVQARSADKQRVITDTKPDCRPYMLTQEMHALLLTLYFASS